MLNRARNFCLRTNEPNRPELSKGVIRIGRRVENKSACLYGLVSSVWTGLDCEQDVPRSVQRFVKSSSSCEETNLVNKIYAKGENLEDFS
jgi:hypothetical protein